MLTIYMIDAINKLSKILCLLFLTCYAYECIDEKGYRNEEKYIVYYVRSAQCNMLFVQESQ